MCGLVEALIRRVDQMDDNSNKMVNSLVVRDRGRLRIVIG